LIDQSEELNDVLKDLADSFSQHSMGGFFRFAKDRELSPSQLRALLSIGREGAQGIKRIGGDMDLTGAAASQIIDRLVGLGLVERREAPDDRRAKRLSLTSRGEQMVSECRESRHSWIFDLVRRIDAERKEGVLAALRLVATKAKEQETASLDPIQGQARRAESDDATT
jgi:DNA-binding MarR family transcriptional regulator